MIIKQISEIKKWSFYVLKIILFESRVWQLVVRVFVIDVCSNNIDSSRVVCFKCFTQFYYF